MIRRVKTVGVYLSASILLFLGILSVTEAPLVGVFFLAAGAFALPIVRQGLTERTDRQLSSITTIAIVLVLITAAVVVIPPSNDEEDVADPAGAETPTEADVETITQTDTPTVEATAIPTASPTASPTATATESPTPALTPTQTATATPTPTLTPTTTPTPQPGRLAVAQIHEDAQGTERENLNDEYVVFENIGDEPLDLSGWTIRDEANHVYTVPDGVTLDASATMTLRTGGGQDSQSDLYWGQEAPVWNNNGDTVIVRDADGELVISESY